STSHQVANLELKPINKAENVKIAKIKFITHKPNDLSFKLENLTSHTKPKKMGTMGVEINSGTPNSAALKATAVSEAIYPIDLIPPAPTVTKLSNSQLIGNFDLSTVNAAIKERKPQRTFIKTTKGNEKINAIIPLRVVRLILNNIPK
ncbi:hypothetical protein, partial [Vibrio parahaemolyticus]|uniref:hypothetical protein n=1 Tax=Vibrio parahaemolyticus TaxID=670 RepID=UPI001171338C